MAISPGLHGIIDYGFGLVGLGAPAALGLTGPAQALPAVWSATQGALNAVTNQPYAVKRLVPFRIHGKAETIGLPAFFIATTISGTLDQPRSRAFFAVLFAALVANYFLTDYDATVDS